MIHARISGPTAPASRNQRAIVWTSQPVSVAGPFVPLIALLASILYQVRKRPMARRIPPTTATISDRETPVSSGFIARTLARSGGLRFGARDGDLDRRAGVALGRSRGAPRLRRGRARRPAEAPPPGAVRRHLGLEDPAGLVGVERCADVAPGIAAAGRELELDARVLALPERADAAPHGQRGAGRDCAGDREGQPVGVVGRLARAV